MLTERRGRDVGSAKSGFRPTVMGGRRTGNQLRNDRKGPGRKTKDYSRTLPKVMDRSAAIRVNVGR